MSGKKKISWDNVDDGNIIALYKKIMALVEKSCERDSDGDLPIDFIIRDRKHEYPFTQIFMIPRGDEEIDTAISLAVANAKSAVDQVDMLIKIKNLKST